MSVDVEQVVRKSPCPTNRKLPSLYYDTTIKKHNLYSTKTGVTGAKKLKPLVLKKESDIAKRESDNTKKVTEKKKPQESVKQTTKKLSEPALQKDENVQKVEEPEVKPVKEVARPIIPEPIQIPTEGEEDISGK